MLDHITALVFPYTLVWLGVGCTLRTALLFRHHRREQCKAPAKGKAHRGIAPALWHALWPIRKDSSREHPWDRLAAAGLHLGVILAGLRAIIHHHLWGFPEELQPLSIVVTSIGLASALALIIRRATTAPLRHISRFDDYLSLALVAFYLLGSLFALLQPEAIGLWRSGAVLLAIYIPLGKIYHMILFFIARVAFGVSAGQRGIYGHHHG